MFLTMFFGVKTALELAMWFSVRRALKQERIVNNTTEAISEETLKDRPNLYKVGRLEDKQDTATENWDKWDKRKNKIASVKDNMHLSPMAYIVSMFDTLTLSALTLHYNGVDIIPLIKATVISIGRGIGLIAV